MKYFGAVLFLWFTLVAWAVPQTSLRTFKLTLPEGREFAYSIQKPLDQKEPIRLEEASTEIAAPDDPNGQIVYVIDLATNRAASKSLVPILKAGSWSPKDSEFKLVGGIDVSLEPKDGVIAAGSLKLLSGDKGEDRLITASANNQAIFRYWPDETIRIRLEYEAEGSTKSVEKVVEVPESAYPCSVTLEVPASFVAPDASIGSEATRNPADRGAKPAGVGFGQVVVGLIIVAGLGYLAYWYYQNNQKVVERLAKQAGLNSLDPADPTGSHPAEPDRRKLETIDLGASAAPTAAAPITATSAARNPRLVNESGEVFLIGPGETTIGREGMLAIAGESSVSRNHARASRDGDTVTLQDSGSTNGTFVNGVKVDSPCVLEPGDTVQFGAARFRYEE